MLTMLPIALWRIDTEVNRVVTHCNDTVNEEETREFFSQTFRDIRKLALVRQTRYSKDCFNWIASGTPPSQEPAPLPVYATQEPTHSSRLCAIITSSWPVNTQLSRLTVETFHLLY